jgi:hypothetical protein
MKRKVTTLGDLFDRANAKMDQRKAELRALWPPQKVRPK